MAAESHNCSSSVGSLAGMITSLAICLESNVWNCKTETKSLKITAFSVAFFCVINIMQPYIHNDIIGYINQLAAVMPSALFVADDYVHCKSHAKTMNTAKILHIIVLPILIYQLTGSTQIHDFVCEGIYSKIPATKTSSHAFVESVRTNAKNVLQEAKESLKNAYRDTS